MSSPRWTPAYDQLFQPDHHLADGAACRRWAWLDLCHMAAWRDYTRILGSTVIDLKRGEVVASIRYLADRWRWPTKKVRIFLDILQHPSIAKLETVRGTSKGTVYRIAKYDTYANPGHRSGHSEGQERGTGGAQEGHKEQQLTSFASPHTPREDLDDFTVAKIRGLYGWDGSEGTDPVLVQAFTDPGDRDRCLSIAIARLESEEGEYRANWFRTILTKVVEEQSENGRSKGQTPEGWVRL